MQSLPALKARPHVATRVSIVQPGQDIRVLPAYAHMRPVCRACGKSKARRGRSVTEAENTLALMRILERTEEYGDCLLWTGATTADGYPIYKPSAGCPCTLVRRSVFELAGGVLLPRQPIVVKCDEKLCVNDAHLAQSTTSKVGKKAGARGAFSSLTRRAKISASARTRAKLNADIAREIRQSSESSQDLAQRYGVHYTLVNRIRNGQAWRDYTPSPWQGLGARGKA